jgi:hypothetical protein
VTERRLEPPRVQASKRRELIAAIAGFRTGAGSNPTPTPIDSVTASAVAAIVSPPDKKQSSISQSVSNPSSSTWTANAGRLAGSACAG